MRYDGFISYSHAADGRLAPALQSALHRLARPWYRLRALHLFRDVTDLSATPALWPRIEEALRDSAALIFLASPEAARSKWVRLEIETWRAKDPTLPVFIVLTDGEIAWNAEGGDFDYEASTALPDVLRGLFGQEPLWVDLRFGRHAEDLSLKNPRFADHAATLAAALRGVPKSMLIGEDIKQHRRTRFIAGTAIVTLVLLLAAAVLSFLAARRQLARANENLANQLATNALSSQDGRDTALITAVAATRLAPTPTAHAALLRLVQRSRQIEKLLYPRQQATNVVSLAITDGGRVAAGLYGGGIDWWDSTGTRRAVGDPDTDVAVAFSNERLITIDGSPLLSIDGKTREIPTDCELHGPFLQMPFAASRGADVITFAAADCGGDGPAIGVCRFGNHPECSATPVTEEPSLLALSHDGRLVAAVWNSRVEIRGTGDFRLIRQIEVEQEEMVVAIGADAAAFDLLLASGTIRHLSTDASADTTTYSAIEVLTPRFSERMITAASTGLERIAFTEALAGIGLRNIDPIIAVVRWTGERNGRLSRIERTTANLAPANKPGTSTLPPLQPSELPPWRDADDHEIDVFDVSDDEQVIATARNRMGEGLFPRIVLRSKRAGEPPLLIDSDGEVNVLAVGSRFVAAATVSIRLWDRRTGAVASESFETYDDVLGLEFDAFDEHLIVRYGDRVETLVTGLAELQRIACEITNRDLSPEEWRARMSSLPYERVCSEILRRPLPAQR